METTSELLGFGLTRANTNKESCKRVMVTDYGGGGFVFGGGPSDGGGSGGGSNNQVASLTDMYDVVGSGSGLGFSFDSSGEMGVRIPFTAAQWQELERQTTIYKHMISSVPVPPELLIPITKNPSQSNRSVRGSLELGLSTTNNSGGGAGTNTDPEPWRCRRTDGKKWRCSRDVAPDQKYCERHSHKGRPRSRKPVELHTPVNNNNNNNNVQNTAHLLNQRGNFLNQTNQQLPVYPNMVSSADATAASFDYRRYFGGFLQEEETLPFVSYLNPEWQQQLTRDSTKVTVIRQQERNLNSNINFGSGDHLQAEESSLLPYPPNRRQQVQETRHFIDAWSTEPRNVGIDNNKYSFKDKLPLTLSMPGGSEYKDIMGSDHENAKPQTQWGSWMDSPPGGPLAEALCLGMGSSGSSALNVASPHGSTSSSCSRGSHGDGGRRTQF